MNSVNSLDLLWLGMQSVLVVVLIYDAVAHNRLRQKNRAMGTQIALLTDTLAANQIEIALLRARVTKKRLRLPEQVSLANMTSKKLNPQEHLL